MRIRDVKPLIEAAVLAEREACAQATEEAGRSIAGAIVQPMAMADAVAYIIRSRPHPSLKIVRPETVEKNPELAKDPTVIVAGVGLSADGNTIIGKWPMAMRHQEEARERRCP